MTVIEIPLDDEELGDAADHKSQGATRLGLPENAEPAELTRAIREYLDEHRQDAATLAEGDEDAYADFILDVAYLWGEQVCRAYDWIWTRLRFDGEEGGICIVSPDRSLSINPAVLIKEIVDKPARANSSSSTAWFHQACWPCSFLAASQDDIPVCTENRRD